MRVPLLLLACLTATTTFAEIRLSVSNLEVVHEGLVNHPLHINLEVTSTSLNMPDLQGGKICLEINGRTCHCYPEAVSQAMLTWPGECARAVGAAQRSRSAVYHLGARVQLAVAASHQSVVTTAPFLSLSKSQNPSSGSGLLTLVLALALSDAPRATEVLLPSLARLSSNNAVAVHEMLVLVPDRDRAAISALLATRSASLPFALVIVPESELLGFEAVVGRYYSYAIQMSLKLLAARLVSTEFYTTLDADVVLLQPTLISRLLVPGPRGVFEDEPRAVHRAWWEGSARLLGLAAPLPLHNNTHVPGSGFGVTPAVLSAYGSLVVLNLLRERFEGKRAGEDGGRENDWVPLWLLSFGSQIQASLPPSTLVWSEYSLYRLGLESVGLFNLLHVPEQTGAGVEGGNGPDDNAGTPRLHCFDVWYADQLPWPIDAVGAHVAAKAKGGCVFSVVQSSTGVAPREIARVFDQEGFR